MAKDKSLKKNNNDDAKKNTPPSGFRIIWREIMHEPSARFALFIVVAILLFLFCWITLFKQSPIDRNQHYGFL